MVVLFQIQDCYSNSFKWSQLEKQYSVIRSDTILAWSGIAPLQRSHIQVEMN